MSLLTNWINEKVRIFHKVLALPTTESAVGIYFVKNDTRRGVYLVSGKTGSKVVHKILDSSDWYTKAEVDTKVSTLNETIDSKISEVDSRIDGINSLNLWIPKNAVPTKADLVTSYVYAVKNWAAMVEADGYIYVNDGLGNTIDNWVNSGQKAFPEDVVEKSDQAIFNVTISVPLAQGTYYTQSGAAEAVPMKLRKYGLIVVYEARDKVWEQMQFTGTGTNITFEWSIPVHWIKIDSMFLDVSYNAGRTFSDKLDARNNIPMRFRKYGVMFQYKLNDLSVIMERYVGDTDYLTSESWYNSSDFDTVYIDGTVNPVQAASLLLNQFIINGVFNASMYSVSKGGSFILSDTTAARNLIPSAFRKKGLIITYYAEQVHGVVTTDSCTEQFIGDDVSNPAFYLDDSKWEYTENKTNVNNLADLRIAAWNQTQQPNIDTIKFLVPDNIFLVKGRKLPFYRDSMFLEDSKNRLRNWEISMNTITSNHEGLCNLFSESINIAGENVGSSIDISVRKPGVTWPYYGKIVDVMTVDASTKSGMSVKVLEIGDSITNRNIPKLTKDILSSYGIIPTMLGTIENIGGEKGEGRENWTLSNVLGWENVWGRISDGHFITPTDNTSTNIYQNPFLKLATSEDKLNHGDFCFRSTGAIKELSYTEETDKTGSFYIFDFYKYVNTNLSGEIPNVVTIALGTNDATKGYTGYYPDVTSPVMLNTRYWKALNFIITNITTYYPSIKIGIVPQYVRFDDYMWQDESYATILIQKTIENIREKGNSNIDVVGVWMNINRYYSSNGKSRSTLDSIMDVDTVSNNGDTLHFDEIGKNSIANSLACFIMNKL